jgi:hypothetical protein
MKLRLAPNWVCPILSFPEGLQPITAAAMCTLALNVLVHLILSLSFSYPYLIKFHYFANNRGWSIKWGVKLRPNKAWLYG